MVVLLKGLTVMSSLRNAIALRQWKTSILKSAFWYDIPQRADLRLKAARAGLSVPPPPYNRRGFR